LASFGADFNASIPIHIHRGPSLNVARFVTIGCGLCLSNHGEALTALKRELPEEMKPRRIEIASAETPARARPKRIDADTQAA
jgi:hypothetical protein